MNLSSLHQTALSWWVDVHTSVPQQTYHIGPFNSREQAKISRDAHVEVLDRKAAGDIVALIKQR